MERKKKVLLFIGEYIGGAERMTIEIGKFLDESKFEPVFVIVGKTKGKIPDFIPERYRILFVHIWNIYDFTTIKFIRLLKKEKPQVVFASTMYLNVRVLLASKIVGGIKNVIRNSNSIESLPYSLKLFVKLTYKYADEIIAQQEEMKEEMLSFLNISEKKIHALHNPIDEEYIKQCLNNVENPYLNNSIKYVWVARFAFTKGQDLLVRAFKRVHDIKPSSHLYLIGSYNEGSEIYKNVSKYIKDNKLDSYVHLIGYDKNPYKWVYYSDCFVQPSRLEGLPNALIEAMYLRKPVVATTCIPMINRIVKEGHNGYLVPSEDIERMSDAMLKALDLKNCEMTYKPASKDEFTRLFE